jgi:hypothetical protein
MYQLNFVLQRVQQGIGFLQICAFKAFREPAECIFNDLSGFRFVTIFDQQLSETYSSTQLKRKHRLARRNLQ